MKNSIKVYQTLLRRVFAGVMLLAACTIVQARENSKMPGEITPGKQIPDYQIMKKASGCKPATASRDLDVNNVRTRILNGGDMWWDLSNARYEIPKVQTGQVAKNALFSGALWIGGITSGNLRVAAQTYRQSGNDFFPGPLTIGTASITEAECKKHDKIYRVTLNEIDLFRRGDIGTAEPSENIKEWLCEGDPAQGQARYLAPFVDVDGDGEYDPEVGGDYPALDHNSDKNIPDMMLFIIYNDKGNIHLESGGLQIGLELHTQAFAYATNDEINNMTFYRTTIFNRGIETIDSCIFGQWVDPDLGNYADDYVECDVARNLGICYNGDDNDEGILGYGINPPSVGVNFFEGPRRPDGSEIGLTKFVYYNNDFTNQGNPTRPEHYWGYLNGKWKDGTPITYGGNGKGGADTASYMFPGSTDPAIPKRPDWTERNSQNQPGDRRFLQTAGPFSLLPGAVNRVTIGVVWARASSGGATGSFNLLKQASDKANILFKNNFNLITGPDAPKLEIVELNRKLIFKMIDTDPVENFIDSFQGPCTEKTVYKFQGYQVFQLKTPNLPNDIYDLTQARLVAQFDVEDGNARIVNSIFDPSLEENVKKIMVDGSDKGISHSFELTKDPFETGADQTFVNFRNYHFVIIAYAAAVNCAADGLQYLPGRRTIGESGPHIYTATPHDPFVRNKGTQLNAEYGMGIPVTQVEGIGNGGNFLELSKASIEQALNASSNYMANERQYQLNHSPVTVKVIDPLKLPHADFTLWLTDTSSNSRKVDTLSAPKTIWYLRNNTTGEVKASTRTLATPNEQLFNEWGISVLVKQSILPGDVDNELDQGNGYLDASVTWENPVQQWLENVTDEDPNYTPAGYGVQFNWIRSGSNGRPNFENYEQHDFAYSDGNTTTPDFPLDPRKNYSKIINGTWAPYPLVARWRTFAPTRMPSFGPGWDRINLPSSFGGTPDVLSAGGASLDDSLRHLHGIDFVITPDRSLWSRCVVVETGDDYRLNQGYADKMDRRRALSVDKYGRNVNHPGALRDPANPESANYLGDSSLGWFPGYAVDVETGERLNIMFGEDSSLPTENGADMMWNPTGNYFVSGNNRPVFGGRHYIYVMSSRKVDFNGLVYPGTRYDGGVTLSNLLDRNPGIAPQIIVRKRQVYATAMWVTMPVLAPGYKLKDVWSGVIPSAVTYKIRVKRPYASYVNAGITATVNEGMPVFNFSTSGFAPTISESIGKSALDKIAVVPNPYYAYSMYEDPGNQLDNRVRLINLPANCTIRIYTMDGVLVRTIRKDDPNSPYLEWNLKNDAQAPISSGIYLIHVKANDFGEERIIKWFAIMRTADYDTF